MRRYKLSILVVLLLSLISGSVAYSGQPIPAPEQGKALVIFMRPSNFGGMIKSSVFDITSGKDEIIGILSAKKKLAYSVSPGKHLFMVIGENAGFMMADLEAGKTYYGLVQVKMGAWKARFSLVPIRKDELDSKEFLKWNKKTKLIENTEKSRAWASKHAPSIEDKRIKYMAKWNKKSAAEKAERTLQKDDGR